MEDKLSYPEQAAGKITTATKNLMVDAVKRFGVTEGALVRMAIEDFVPRFLANAGRPENAELFAKLARAMDEDRTVAGQVKSIIHKSTRNNKRRAA